MKKTFAISNTIALIITIAINYLSNTGLLNGNTMATISSRYSNYFTPAGYAFSIWGLIYLGLIGFVFYGWRSLSDKSDQLLSNIGWWFVVSCIANSLWVVVWLYDQLALSVLLMTLLWFSLYKIVQNTNIAGREALGTKTLLYVFWPFSIYFGWVTVAFIADVAAFLTKSGWDRWGISGIMWTVIMVAIAGLVNLAVIVTKKLHPFALVGVWAVLAIAVRNKNAVDTNSIVNTCYAVAALLLVVVAISVLNRKVVKA